ncbi:MAG: uroporphyrinogen decarboxylase family protein [Planctomycetota bacterium]
MTPLDRMRATWQRTSVDRIPFVPAIYEHKAALLGRAPGDLCHSAELLALGVDAEVATYDADALVVGIDVYNVEAEALGVPLRPSNPDEVPALDASSFAASTDWATVLPPDPLRAGRMPMHVEACRRAMAAHGSTRAVRGALTGPLSLAAGLTDFSQLCIDLLENPEHVESMLRLGLRTALRYGEALAATGVGLVVFDSRLAPPFVSPRIFDRIQPLYRELFAGLNRISPLPVELVIGGNTTVLATRLANLGAGQVLCDAGADPQRWRTAVDAAGIALRVNFSAVSLTRNTETEITAAARKLLHDAAGPGLVLGTGVVDMQTPPSRVLAVRRAVTD